MAAELNRFKMYDMLKIYSCQVKGDKIILTDIEHKEVLDLHGQVKPPHWAANCWFAEASFGNSDSVGHQVS